MKGLTQKELYHQGYLQRIWTRYDRQNSAGPEDQSPLFVLLSLHGIVDICLLNSLLLLLLLLLPCKLTSFSLKSQTPTHFSFSQMAYKFQLSNLSLGFILLWNPHIYVV